MNERDELAKLLFITDNFAAPEPEHEWEMTIRHNAEYAKYVYFMADAILAAGYRKPRTITTIGTMPDLVGTVILTAHGKVMCLIAGMENHWQTPNSPVWYSPLVEWLPATVLYYPHPTP